MEFSKKSSAFTLAEVLITLGIIGVVAAMTMPTLINQTNGAQYKAAYKKALSAISQGVTLNVALDDISFADATAEAAAGVNSTPDTIAYILSQRMNVVKVDTELGYGKNGANSLKKPEASEITDSSSNTTLFFNDGSAFQFNPATAKVKGCTQLQPIANNNQKCFGFIDVNGLKGPNRIVTCDETGTEHKGTGGCTVKSPTDIYPVVYYDQTILPNSDAAKAVLYGK